MTTFVGRSPLEIAEDALLFCMERVYNYSPADAEILQIQRREVGSELREKAEALFAVWEGTPKQREEAGMLAILKRRARR